MVWPLCGQNNIAPSTRLAYPIANTSKEGQGTMRRTQGGLFKRGGVWWVKWVYKGVRHRQTTHTGVLRDAKTKADEILAPFRQRSTVETLTQLQARVERGNATLVELDRKRNPPPPIAAAWQTYVDAGNRKQIGAWTQRNYNAYWRRFSCWLAAAAPEVKDLAGVSFSIAEQYMADLASKDKKGRAPTGRTMNAHRAFLRAFWNVLKEKAGLVENPWAKIAKRDETPVSRRPLSVAELREVCRKATGEMRYLLAMGLFLGCRLGDAVMMRWANVDMRRLEIRYMPRKTARKVGTHLLVPMHPELCALLAETPAGDRKGYVVPDMAERYQRTGPAGVTVLVQKHFAACGLERTSAREGAGQRRAIVAGFHSLRHAAVSLLREAGAAESVSMAIVGHNDSAVHAVYTHVGDSAMRLAVANLPAVFNEPSALLPPATKANEAKTKMIDATSVLALADKLNGQTWAVVRDELRALAQDQESAGTTVGKAATQQ